MYNKEELEKVLTQNKDFFDEINLVIMYNPKRETMYVIHPDFDTDFSHMVKLRNIVKKEIQGQAGAFCVGNRTLVNDHSPMEMIFGPKIIDTRKLEDTFINE